MSGLSFPRVIPVCGGILLSLVMGCGHTPQESPTAGMMPPPSQSIRLIAEIKAEAEGLRRELAAERIQAAKKQAEFVAARKAASTLREREAKLVEKISATETEVTGLKTERDQLRRENSSLRAEAANVPQLLQLVSEMRTVHSSLNGMVGNFKTLTGDFAKFQQDLRKFRAELKGESSEGDFIAVQRGDTLWDLAQEHGISVSQLKEANQLTGHLIYPGQQLALPDLTFRTPPSPSKTPNVSANKVDPE